MPVRVQRICRQRGATKSGTWLRKTVLTVLQGQGPGKAFEGPAPEACPWPANVDNEDDNLSRGFSVGKLDGGWGSKETLRCEVGKVHPYEGKRKRLPQYQLPIDIHQTQKSLAKDKAVAGPNRAARVGYFYSKLWPTSKKEIEAMLETGQHRRYGCQQVWGVGFSKSITPQSLNVRQCCSIDVCNVSKVEFKGCRPVEETVEMLVFILSAAAYWSCISPSKRREAASAGLSAVSTQATSKYKFKAQYSAAKRRSRRFTTLEEYRPQQLLPRWPDCPSAPLFENCRTRPVERATEFSQFEAVGALGLWRFWEELMPSKQLTSQVEHPTLSSPPYLRNKWTRRLINRSLSFFSSKSSWASASRFSKSDKALSPPVLEASSPSETGSPEVVWAAAMSAANPATS